MKKNKKMKNKYKKQKSRFILLIVVLLSILACVLMINIVIDFNKPLYTKTVPVRFQISDRIGITINKTALDYGKIPVGMSSSKEINLLNEYEFPVVVKISITPELEGFIFGRTDMVIQPGETIVYGASLMPPPNVEPGNYSGEMQFDFYAL